MPAAAKTVLEAAQTARPGWENRLTAIFAAVLAQHPALADELFEEVGLSGGHDQYLVATEEWVTSTRRIDLTIRAKTATRGAASQLWCENKRRGGRFNPGQREDYWKALQNQGGGRMATIVADIRNDEREDQLTPRAEPKPPAEPTATVEADTDEPRWRVLDWQRIAELADRVGRRASAPWGGPAWRDRALLPDAPAQHRALVELVWYLEREGYAAVTALGPDLISALRQAPQLDRVSRTLLRRASDNIPGLELDGTMRQYVGAFEQSFHVPAGSWVARFSPEAYIDIALYPDDGWAWTPTGSPAFAAGVSLELHWFEPLSALDRWTALLHQAGYSFAEYADYLRVYATYPLENLLADHHENITTQAEALATWARQELKTLVLDNTLDPGDVRPPVKPRRPPATRRP